MENTIILRLEEDDSEQMHNREQLSNIYHLFSQVVAFGVPGDAVDLGCYTGTVAVLLQNIIDYYGSDKELHLYDSFQGLPEKTERDGDTRFEEGDCRTSLGELIAKFKKFDTRLPKIHVGWFEDTIPQKLPEKICFAHLDGDFYTSIVESLEGVYPRLSRNATVVIDDYCDPAILDVHNILPGVKKACDDFLKDKEEEVSVLICGSHQCHGFFRKL